LDKGVSRRMLGNRMSFALRRGVCQDSPTSCTRAFLAENRVFLAYGLTEG
jgi:hypothetical protein